MTRSSEKIDSISEGCKRQKNARESQFGHVLCFIIILMRFLQTKYIFLYHKIRDHFTTLVSLVPVLVVLCMIFCMRYKSMLYCIFLCILMNPVCWGEREKLSRFSSYVNPSKSS